jgi:orotate phosphoribosyltransferase
VRDLRTELLACTLVPNDQPLASGKFSNNKLDIERVEHTFMLRARVAAGMANLMKKYRPNAIVSTPRGADWIALECAWQLGKSVVFLDKNKETKEFSYRHEGERIVKAVDRLVIVDDVLNDLTSTGKVYRLPHMAERTQAIVGVWDRNPNRETTLPVPIDALVSEEIPLQLPPDSPLWNIHS